MWANYRKWKHALAFPLMALAWWLLKGEHELSLSWIVGLVIGCILGIAYLIKEVVWMFQRRGRPCRYCGERIQMKSFHVQIACPHCGQSIE